MRSLFARYRVLLIPLAALSFFVNLLLLAPTIYLLQLFDRVFASRSNETLIWLTAITISLLLVYLVVDWLRGRLLSSLSALVDHLIGETVMRKVLEAATSPGNGATRQLARDASTLRAFFGGQSILAVLDVPWLPIFIVVIFLFHPVLGLMALASAIVLVTLALLNFKVTQASLEKIQSSTQQASRMIDVGVRNAEVIKAMGMATAVVSRWSRINQAALDRMRRLGNKTAWLSGGSKFIRQSIQVVMLATGAYLVIDQHVTPGVMMAVTLILGRALMPVEQLITHWKAIGEARAAYLRLDKAFQADALGVDRLSLPKFEGNVVADRVVCSVKAGVPPILRGVTFAVNAGEFLGVIGPSGSGKSTLARVLTGVWRANSGTVRFDGADIAHWDSERLGVQIGYLPQDVELFPGTVAENIARMGAVDDEAVIRAARMAGVHDVILALPDGYETDIGVDGAHLSGGQRQRVALARALYGDCALVVLDEPNANLDAEGEMALVSTLDRLKQSGVTVVMVCHKPSLLAKADHLLVLREGVTVAFGPRDEVLAKLASVTPITAGEHRGRA